MHSSDNNITAQAFDTLMQDTWLLALAIRNGKPPVVDDVLYRHCLGMIQQVQEKLTSMDAPEYLTEEIKFAHCVFVDEAIMSQPDIRSQAPNTKVNVFPHHPVRMPVAKRARLSLRDGMPLDQHPVLGNETTAAGYCSRLELSTENPDEAKGWMPGGQLKQDVMPLLRTYLGCDYDVRLWLAIPTRLLPVPRLGDPRLFSGYNMMLGLRLREDNLGEMPKTTRIKVGRLREDSAEFGRV